MGFMRRSRRFAAVRTGRRASYREGLSFGALSFVLSASLSTVSSILSSRLYGVGVIGEYALAVGAVAYVRLMSTAKERPALIRELATLEPRVPRIGGLFFAVLTFSVVLTWLVSGLALGIVHFMLSGPVARPGLFLPLAVNVAGYALLGNTTDNLEVVAQGFRAGRMLFLCRVTDGLTFLLIAVPLGLTHGTVWGLIIASVGSQFIGVVHRAFRIRAFMRFRTPREELAAGFKTLPGLIRFGLKITPGALADGAANESGTWLVASFNPIGVVGAYGRAYLLVKQFVLVQYGNEMLFPTLLERRAKGDKAGHARAVVDSLRYVAMGVLLFAAAGGGIAPAIMRVFGAGFVKGANALAVLLVMPMLYMLSQMMRLALLAENRPWMWTILGIVRLVVTFGLGLVLAWKFGAVGAASALVIGLAIDVAVCIPILVPHLDIPFLKLWPLRQMLVIPVAYAAAFAGGRLIDIVLPWEVALFVGAAAGCAIYIAVLWLGRALNERDRQRYRDIRRRLSRRRSRLTGPIVVTARRYSEPLAGAGVIAPAFGLAAGISSLPSAPIFSSARRTSSLNGAAVHDELASKNGSTAVPVDRAPTA